MAVGVDRALVRREALDFVGGPVGEVQSERGHGRRAAKVFVREPHLEHVGKCDALDV